MPRIKGGGGMCVPTGGTFLKGVISSEHWKGTRVERGEFWVKMNG